MKPVSLTAYPRTLNGRNQLKKLRAKDRIPAVLYGNKVENQDLEVPSKQLESLIHHTLSEHILVDMLVEGDARAKRLAMLREVQHHPLTGRILHVDFHEVDANKPVVVAVPVETKGEAIGVKRDGGTLEHVLFNVKVKGLPLNIPEVIELDVTHLALAEILHVGDIPMPEGVEIMADKAIPVVTVKAPRVSEDEATAEGGEAATAAAPAAAA